MVGILGHQGNSEIGGFSKLVKINTEGCLKPFDPHLLMVARFSDKVGGIYKTKSYLYDYIEATYAFSKLIIWRLFEEISLIFFIT